MELVKLVGIIVLTSIFAKMMLFFTEPFPAIVFACVFATMLTFSLMRREKIIEKTVISDAKLDLKETSKTLLKQVRTYIFQPTKLIIHQMKQ
ncbi:hypothetical protein [Caloramator sp. Dgby_cultured_2]|uniref:hypothetical protein n=1 Tax=Caloramator sp. Dgby_cultured_2 TaxID=3029174 RepID=UPI00237D3E7F|nr:hypothetical protein [Caloramator sp. Dgby_cultured_2]WDU82624.1 hypothetical protein PWK10_13790 [Caloramator sp. Dgby_cultured_2]